ncbi:MAG TPA: lipopolysaccharide core heptose(II) kinase RfaY, partial [Candidatus Nanoarchaeia archaeon]|nr:lipopolysaccharide core heptose(II) kinase RfaY [Candidatus Nanoarchaeia archaeon]
LGNEGLAKIAELKTVKIKADPSKGFSMAANDAANSDSELVDALHDPIFGPPAGFLEREGLPAEPGPPAAVPIQVRLEQRVEGGIKAIGLDPEQAKAIAPHIIKRLGRIDAPVSREQMAQEVIAEALIYDFTHRIQAICAGRCRNPIVIEGGSAVTKEYQPGVSDRDINIFVDKLTSQEKGQLEDLVNNIKDAYRRKAESERVDPSVVDRVQFFAHDTDTLTTGNIGVDEVIFSTQQSSTQSRAWLWANIFRHGEVLYGAPELARVTEDAGLGAVTLEQLAQQMPVSVQDGVDLAYASRKSFDAAVDEGDVHDIAKAATRTILGRIIAQDPQLVKNQIALTPDIEESTLVVLLARNSNLFSSEELTLITQLAQARQGLVDQVDVTTTRTLLDKILPPPSAIVPSAPTPPAPQSAVAVLEQRLVDLAKSQTASIPSQELIAKAKTITVNGKSVDVTLDPSSGTYELAIEGAAPFKVTGRGLEEITNTPGISFGEALSRRVGIQTIDVGGKPEQVLLRDYIASGDQGFVQRVTVMTPEGPKDYALKINYPEFAGDVQREQALLSYLNSPAARLSQVRDGQGRILGGIVGYDGTVRDPTTGLEGFLMEEVKGKRINQVGGISPDVQRRIEVIIEALHQAGAVHRDLHVGNILVTDDGQIKIIDVGRSALTSEAARQATGVPESAILTDANGKAITDQERIRAIQEVETLFLKASVMIPGRIEHIKNLPLEQRRAAIEFLSGEVQAMSNEVERLYTPSNKAIFDAVKLGIYLQGSSATLQRATFNVQQLLEETIKAQAEQAAAQELAQVQESIDDLVAQASLAPANSEISGCATGCPNKAFINTRLERAKGASQNRDFASAQKALQEIRTALDQVQLPQSDPYYQVIAQLEGEVSRAQNLAVQQVAPAPQAPARPPLTPEQARQSVRQTLPNVNPIVKLHERLQGITLKPDARPEAYDVALEIARKMEPVHGVRTIDTLLAILESGKLLTARELGPQRVTMYNKYAQLGQLDTVFMSSLPHHHVLLSSQAPLLVFKREWLARQNFDATSTDSIEYSRAELQDNKITTR